MSNNTNILHQKIKYTIEDDFIQSSKKFTKQEVDLNKTPLFFPQGYENIFLTIYFIVLPYIVGFLFLFFYVYKAKQELFKFFDGISSVLFTWAIGYEILAVLIILYIIKIALSFSRSNDEEKPFQRP